jgi:thiamine-phosphate pyrophosphorylase
MIQKVQFITNNFTRSHWENAELACKGGIKWIQLRVKDTHDDDWLKAAEKTQDVCVKYGATFIINDHIELTQKLLADGIHLGLEDTPTDQARTILGDQYIIGGTANTYEHILQHHQAHVDYVGIGPYKFTDTKEKLSPILGIEGYKQLLAKLHTNNINLPLIAIGGIQLNDIKPLINLGLFGIAVSSLITTAKDPTGMAELIIKETE